VDVPKQKIKIGRIMKPKAADGLPNSAPGVGSKSGSVGTSAVRKRGGPGSFNRSHAKRAADQREVIQKLASNPLLDDFVGPLSYDPSADIEAEVRRAVKGVLELREELKRYEKSARIKHYNALAGVLALKLVFKSWPDAPREKLLTQVSKEFKLTRKASETHALLRVLIQYPVAQEKRRGDWVFSRDAAVIDEAVHRQLDAYEFLAALKRPKGGGLGAFVAAKRARKPEKSAKTGVSKREIDPDASNAKIPGRIAAALTPPVSEQKKAVENEPHLVWGELTYEELTAKLKRRHEYVLVVRIDPHDKSIKVRRALGTAEATLKGKDADEIAELLKQHPKIVDYKETI